jgi:triacylglycerol esterase/lipase EstA (alpha/beta hydrolase family)
MIHGLGQGPGIFDDLISALVRRGEARECLLAIDYSDSNLPVRLAAEQELRPFIDRILAELRERAQPARTEGAALKVNLIGHSMGALSSRWTLRG